MATFVQIPDPTAPPIIHTDRHLGKRLYAQRTRCGIPLETAALALQVDTHTLTALEAGDAIPPRLSGRLRTYLLRLEATPTGHGNDEPEAAEAPAPPEAPAPADTTEATEAAPLPTDHQPPTTVSFPDWVRAERHKRGWTQRELGQRAGVGHATINKLENGAFTPSPVLRARLEATLTAWLDDEPSTHHPLPTTHQSLPTPETPMPDPAFTHPAILPDPAPADDVPTEAEADADPAPSDSSFSVHPSSVPPRLFTSFQFNLPRPSGRDVALLALLDKFPPYSDMHGVGEQTQWFRYFDALARLALAHPDKE